MKLDIFTQGLESLVERAHQGDLEKELLRSFPEEERQKFGLPPIYRGLPKLYLKENPRFFRIRENFNDLPLLRRLYLDKALLKLYSPVRISKRDEVVIFTWMMEDGLGDATAQVEAARILQNRFPDLKIKLILLAPENKTLPSSPFPRHIGRYNDPISLPPISSLILQLPTFYPHTKTLFHLHRLELLGECGLIDRAWFHPKTGGRCLGLHFLEKGIFIKSVKASPLQDDRLSELLSQKAGRFNLNYTKSRRGNLLYFHTLLKSLAQSCEPITIAFSNRDAVIDLLQNELLPILRRYNIAKVRFYFQNFVTEIPIQQKGKPLTLIHIETISQQDFHSLIKMSDDLVGCTGDGSLTETIAAQKPFFYDPPYHKRPFLKDLIEIVKHELAYPAFLEFLQLSLTPADPKLEDDLAGWLSEADFKKIPEEEVGEKLGALMQSPDLRNGTAALSQILANNYNANDTLCHLVQRALLFKKHPDYQRKEKKALQGFIQGSGTLSSALEKIPEFLIGKN